MAFGKLLKPAVLNPYATLITLFLSAISEISRSVQNEEVMENLMRKVMCFLPPRIDTLARYMHCGESVRADKALTYFEDHQRLFNVYMKKLNLIERGRRAGVRPKSEHTIVDPWPHRLEPSATQEDFEVLDASSRTGREHYMEWMRLEPSQGSGSLKSVLPSRGKRNES